MLRLNFLFFGCLPVLSAGCGADAGWGYGAEGKGKAGHEGTGHALKLPGAVTHSSYLLFLTTLVSNS